MTPEASACPCCLITSSQENLGASESRNRGLEESAAEWVLLLDDDVIPGASWARLCSSTWPIRDAWCMQRW